MYNDMLKTHRTGKRCKEIEWVVDDRGCWICTSHATNFAGYPQYTTNGKTEYMHRYVYEKLIGSIKNGLCLCHKCDNRKCINPEHLFVGTRSDNNKDRKDKGRNGNLNGVNNPKAKLTEEQIMEIRNIKHMTQSKIANIYNITRGHVSNIRRLYNWKCIKENKDAR